MDGCNLPQIIDNWIGGETCGAVSGESFDKLSPATGQKLYGVTRSKAQDIERAVEVAARAQSAWAAMTPVQRGDILSHRPDDAQTS